MPRSISSLKFEILKRSHSGRVMSTEFMHLPNKKQWAIYYKQIKTPQCVENIFVCGFFLMSILLNSIWFQRKIKRKDYRTSAAFASDVELVFSNAMAFNQVHSGIWEDALALRVSCRRKSSIMSLEDIFCRIISDSWCLTFRRLIIFPNTRAATSSPTRSESSLLSDLPLPHRQIRRWNKKLRLLPYSYVCLLQALLPARQPSLSLHQHRRSQSPYLPQYRHLPRKSVRPLIQPHHLLLRSSKNHHHSHQHCNRPNLQHLSRQPRVSKLHQDIISQLPLQLHLHPLLPHLRIRLSQQLQNRLCLSSLILIIRSNLWRCEFNLRAVHSG